MAIVAQRFLADFSKENTNNPLFFSDESMSAYSELEAACNRKKTRPLDHLALHGGVSHWVRQTFRNLWATSPRQTEVRSENTQGESLTNNFRLIDVLTDMSARLLENPELLVDHSREKEELVALMKEQISAFVAEELGLPHHSYANELDWAEYVATGQVLTFHPHYKNTATRGDLLTMARKAGAVNHGAEGARYRREQEQLEVLYEQLAHELKNWQNPDVWQQTTAGQILSPAVRRQHGITDLNESVFVGNKYALVMPENSLVYPEGKAYTNIHQLVFFPQSKKAILLIEQWFDAHTYTDQATILNTWEEDAIPDGVILTEDILMSAVVTLPAELKKSPAFSVFADMARSLDAQKSDTNFRLRQQTTLGLLHANHHSIEHAATFLTQVLITEYLVCLEHPEALTDLSARLWGAYEMMAHPFLSGETFQYEAARDAYMTGYLSQWLTGTADTAHTAIPRALQEQTRRAATHAAIQNHMQYRSPGQLPLTTQQQKQRNASLEKYAKLGYPNILNRIASEAWCATGSVGGLNQVSQTLNSSLGQSVLNGHFVNMQELSKVIGHERAKDWEMGVCANPNCPRGTATQLIGECDYCLHCELLSLAGHELQKRGDSSHESDLQKLNRFAQQGFTNPDDITEAYRRQFHIGIDVLPTYMLAGETVLR